MKRDLIRGFCGRTLAEKTKLNLDKARQKTTVLKYAFCFREHLLELLHRHEEDNVHYLHRGLRPSIHKEVALKNPKTLHETIQAALRAEAKETKIETTQRSTCRQNVIEKDSDPSEAAEEVDIESEGDSHGASCTRFDASLKTRSIDLRRRTSASLATRGDTLLSTAHTQRTKRTTERGNPGRDS
jgi:hypothetical protein